MDRAFQSHKLNAEGFKKAQQISEVFDAALTQIEFISGPLSREMAIVRTKLEEACFFAKKAMASNPDNQFDENRAVCGQFAPDCATPDAGPNGLHGRLGNPLGAKR